MAGPWAFLRALGPWPSNSSHTRNMSEHGGWGLASPSCVLDPGWGGSSSSLPHALSRVVNILASPLNSGFVGWSAFWTPAWSTPGSPAQQASSPLGSPSGRWLCSARPGGQPDAPLMLFFPWRRTRGSLRSSSCLGRKPPRVPHAGQVPTAPFWALHCGHNQWQSRFAHRVPQL